MKAYAFRLQALGVMATILVACSSAGTTPTTSSNLGGDRLPVQRPEETYPHTVTELVGTLMLKSNGCWFVDLGDQERLVVFPVGYTRPASDGSVMVGPEDVVLHGGTQIKAQGGAIGVDLIPGGRDGFWGGYVGFCSPEAEEMIVLDSLTVVGGRLDT
ncbi:MAG: hypothetical protein WAN34_02780 [Acidimicrobiia bacterium]